MQKNHEKLNEELKKQQILIKQKAEEEAQQKWEREQQRKLMQENVNKLNEQKVQKRAQKALNGALNDIKNEFDEKTYLENKKKEN